MRDLTRPLFRHRDATERHIEVLSEEVERLSAQLPIVLNAIETQNAAAREFERSKRALTARLEEQTVLLAEVEARLAALEPETRDGSLDGRLSSATARICASG